MTLFEVETKPLRAPRRTHRPVGDPRPEWSDRLAAADGQHWEDRELRSQMAETMYGPQADAMIELFSLVLRGCRQFITSDVTPEERARAIWFQIEHWVMSTLSKID